MKKNKSIGFLLLGLLLLASFGAWWGLSSRPQQESAVSVDSASDALDVVEMDADKAQLHGITTKKSGPGTLMVTLFSRGKIVMHPDRFAHILPKVPGVAREARKNMGDAVEKDEVIAVLESREMADIKADYLAALEKEKLASSLFEREARLYDKKVSSEQEFLNSKFSFEGAKINAQLARQKLFAIGLSEKEISQMANQSDADFRLYEIRAPIGGAVIDRHITYGEYIEDTTPIYEIADLSRVWVEIGVYPKDLGKVKEGQIVTISHPNDQLSAQGKIIYLSPVIAEDTITAKAVAELENLNGEWKPGSFVKVEILTDHIAAPVIVSKESVQIVDGEAVVFIRTPEGFQKNQVQLGQCDNHNIEIIAGLEPGVDYAATETFLLKADLGKDSVEHGD